MHIISNRYVGIFLSHLIILFSSYVNAFPEGYIFASGDIVQFYNFESLKQEGLSLLSYSNGLGKWNQAYPYYPYYFVVALFSDFFSLSLSSLSVVYIYVFSLMSYCGFRFALSFSNHFDNLGYLVKELLSLTYVFNIVVYYYYVYTWGFTPFPIIYAFLPIIIMSLICLLTNRDKKKDADILIKSTPIFLVSGMAYGNFSWFVVVLTSTGILYLIWLITHARNQVELKVISQKYAIFLFVYVISTLWATYSMFGEMLTIFKYIYYGKYYEFYDLASGIYDQAILTRDVFFSSAGLFFFDTSRKNLSVYFGVCLIVFPFYLFLRRYRKTVDVSIVIVLLGTFLLMTVLATKFRAIIDRETLVAVFSSPVLLSFRGSEKSITLFPSLLLLSTAFLLKLHNRKIFLSSILLAASMISSYPLVLGGIKTHYDLLIPFGQNHKTVDRSMLHKIPEDYFAVAKIINSDKSFGKVMNMPSTKHVSHGWVEYPSWPYVGVDPTAQLINRGVIQPNSYGYIGPDDYGAFFNDFVAPVEFVKVMTMLNVKYIMFHEDADENDKVTFRKTLKILEDSKKIERVFVGDYVVLYQVIDYSDSTIVLPNILGIISEDIGFKAMLDEYSSGIMYVNREQVRIKNDEFMKHFILRGPADGKDNSECDKLIDLRKQHGKKIVVLETCDKYINVLDTDSFHDRWRIKKVSRLDKVGEFDITNTVKSTHFKANFFGNGWLINLGDNWRENSRYKFYIEYISWDLFYFLLAAPLLLVTMVSIRSRFK